MNKNLKISFWLFFVTICAIPASSYSTKSGQDQRKVEQLLRAAQAKTIEDDVYTIKNIYVIGNKQVRAEPILNGLPYKVGDIFNSSKSSMAINNLYGMGHFRDIVLEGEILDSSSIDLYVIVQEKKLLERVDFVGNKAVATKKLREKLQLEKIKSIDEETIQQLITSIKKVYREENRHFVSVKTKLIPDKQNPDKVVLEVSIAEGSSTHVVRVYFKGNEHIPDRKLRGAIFTRENWLLSFMDSAGTFNQEAVDIDKHRIEYFYRDNGYLMVKVVKADVKFSRKKKDAEITFHIKEGKQFKVRSIHAPGDEIFLEEDLLPLIALEQGEPYSQSKVVTTMNRMRDLWGEKGYIYADVYPQIKPDETTNEVDITFHVERGDKLYANRVLISGNKVTRDKVIRRQLEIFEGDLITTQKLKKSKNNVEYLSFFEREGVNWNLHRLSDSQADVELQVREAKTGNFNFQLTYGTDTYNPRPTLRGMIVLEKGNLFGKGWDTGAMVQADRHRVRKLELHFFDPHILDSDVSAGIYAYSRWDEYIQWTGVDKTPVQVTAGGDIKFGFGLPMIDKHLRLILDIGIESITNNKPNAKIDLFAPIVARSFQQGTLQWFGVDLVKDTRNHQVYPNAGYKLVLATKTALPFLNEEFGFFKIEGHASNYLALIGTDSLVLANQLKLSHIAPLGGTSNAGKNRVIPYKELFHMGGQTTVRGFVWGGIEPAWKLTNDPLGARNAVQFNTELIFPLIPDYSMKGHFFYDTGAGWNTPKQGIIDIAQIKRDEFTMRHSVGFGVNLLKPFPAKIDWGFKLDRQKNEGESPSEFHLSMNYAW